jgi:GMP synthase PP-ATPase subunit
LPGKQASRVIIRTNFIEVLEEERLSESSALYLIGGNKSDIQIPEAKQQYKNQHKGYPVVFFHF